MGLVAVAVAGCGGPPYWHGDPQQTAVAVVGDSYVRQLEFNAQGRHDSAFTAELRDEGWRAHVRGESGWPTARVQGLVADAVDQGADGIAIVAGVNDVAWALQRPDLSDAEVTVAADVRAVLDAASPARCVVWPTVAPGEPSAASANRVVMLIDGILHEEARARRGLVVPEWGERLRAHPEWIGPDGLHLSELGEAELRTLLVGELHACLDAPERSPVPSSPNLPA
jgi:hypothetical protein